MTILARITGLTAAAVSLLFSNCATAACMEFHPDRDAEAAAAWIIRNASVVMYARVAKAEIRRRDGGVIPAQLVPVDLLKGPRLSRYIMRVPQNWTGESYAGLPWLRAGEQTFIVLYGTNRRFETSPCDYSGDDHTRAALVRMLAARSSK